MKFLTIIIFLGFSIACKAQNINTYYYNLYQADSLAQRGNLDSSLLMYEEAFKQVGYIHSRILLTKAIPTAKDAKNIVLVKKYKSILKNQKKCPKENRHILHLVDSVVKLDQEVRSSKIFKARKFYNDNIDNALINNTKKFHKAKILNDLHDATDSSNIIYMLNLIAKYGYIGEEVIGFKNLNKVQAILLHYDKDTNNQILGPVLKNALVNNKITPLMYAMITDRHLYSTSHTQKYWTWFMIDADPELTEEQIQTILKLREQIGLWGTEYKTSNYKGSWMLNVLTNAIF